jgi:hypothetical protein
MIEGMIKEDGMSAVNVGYSGYGAGIDGVSNGNQGFISIR